VESSPPETRAATLKEILRILRPGGRVMVVATAGRGGLAALFGSQQTRSVDPEPWLESDGFRGVRRLAERDHLIFVEGLKPRTAP
jgi:hypothetical protein